MRETEYTRRLMQEVTDDGGIVVVNRAGREVSGWPDRLIYHRLWRGLVEMKGPSTTIQKNQRKHMRDLWRRSPGGVWVIREAGIKLD